MSQRDQSAGNQSKACPACRENALRFRHLHPGCECHRRRACRAAGQIVYPSPPRLRKGGVCLMDNLRIEGDGVSIARDCGLCWLEGQLIGMRLEGLAGRTTIHRHDANVLLMGPSCTEGKIFSMGIGKPWLRSRPSPSSPVRLMSAYINDYGWAL